MNNRPSLTPRPSLDTKPALTLSAGQSSAFDAIKEWHECGDSPDFRLGGYAGTGKTTLLRNVAEWAEQESLSVIALAPTGKACSVLTRKGVPTRTIHSYLYRKPYRVVCESCKGAGVVGSAKCEQCKGSGKEPELWWEARQSESADLIIVDEASMVQQREFDNLMEKSIPILWVGDPAQLEPVGSDPRIMHAATVVLTEILRTDCQSILEFSRHLRDGGEPVGSHVFPKPVPDSVLERADIIIAGTNRTRHRINARVRKLLGMKGILAEGDRLICLQNKSASGVVNGDQGVVGEVGNTVQSKFAGMCAQVRIDFEHRDSMRTHIPLEALGGASRREFPYHLPPEISVWDYGYCVTAHKAQGSEWKKVVVIDESWPGMDRARWRYTAATRSIEALGFYVGASR